MPAGGERTGLGLAIAHDARDQQVGIVKRRAEGVRQRITQLAAFVNGTRRFRSDVAWNAAWEGELFEQLLHSVGVLRHVRINFTIGSFKVGVRDQARPAVARPGDIDNIQVLLLDHAVEMDVNEVQSGSRAPVPQQARFDVLALEWPLEQGIVVEINLADRQIVGRPPVGVHFFQQIR